MGATLARDYVNAVRMENIHMAFGNVVALQNIKLEQARLHRRENARRRRSTRSCPEYAPGHVPEVWI
jgi:hypothetical protein